LIKQLKYNYVFFREALRTATCSMISKTAIEDGYYNENSLSRSKRLKLDEKIYKYLKCEVGFYSDNKYYYLVKDDKIVFVGTIKGKEVSKQIYFDFKHFHALYNSLIFAYQQDNISLRKVIKNYPSMLRLYYEMAKRDLFTKLKL